MPSLVSHHTLFGALAVALLSVVGLVPPTRSSREALNRPIREEPRYGGYRDVGTPAPRHGWPGPLAAELSATGGPAPPQYAPPAAATSPLAQRAPSSSPELEAQVIQLRASVEARCANASGVLVEASA